MKKIISMMLALCLLGGLTACGSSYRTYDYEYGGIHIQLPKDAEDPKDEGTKLVVTDPEEKWELELQPLDYDHTKIELNEVAERVKSSADTKYIKDLKEDKGKYGDYDYQSWTFDYNPDRPHGSAHYQEPGFVEIISYGDRMIGKWGGLKLHLTGLDKEAAIADLMSDDLAKAMLENITFDEASKDDAVSIPGISATFPATWKSGTSEPMGIYASIRGEKKGVVHIDASIPADPQEGASWCQSDGKEFDFGDNHYYAAIQTFPRQDEPDRNYLYLYTKFNENYSLKVSVYLYDTEKEGLWDYLNSEEMTGVMNSIKLDADKFADPNKERVDADGFECDETGRLSAYSGDKKDITIPATIGKYSITTVRSDAFRGNKDITSVTLAEGITTLDYAAFQDCKNLTTVTLPSSLTYIGSRAFEGCEKLKTVHYSDGLTTIDSNAFSGCTSLESGGFPASLSEIGNYAFEDCGKLGDVTLPDGVNLVGEHAFVRAGSGGKFQCGDNVTFGKNALQESHFATVQLGGNCDLSAEQIMAGAKVGKLTIGEGCTKLGKDFASCGWVDASMGEEPMEVTLPESLKEMGENAFALRPGLKAIDLKQVETMGKGAFKNAGISEVTIPGTMKTVSEEAFYQCKNLKTIDVAEGVETIEPYAFFGAGYRETEKELYFYTLNDEAVEKVKSKLLEGDDIPLFVKVTLPSTLKSVGDRAFGSCHIDGLYMTWCHSAKELPKLDKGFVSEGKEYINQVYFEKDVIDACGKELDAALGKTNIGETAWYDDGYRRYWSDQAELPELE